MLGMYVCHETCVEINLQELVLSLHHYGSWKLNSCRQPSWQTILPAEIFFLILRMDLRTNKTGK